MANIEPAIGVIQLIDKATAPIKAVINSLSNLTSINKKVIPTVDGVQKSINRLGRVNANIKRNTDNIAGQAVATAGLVLGMKAAIQPAIDFEQSMMDLKSVMYGLNPTSNEATQGMKLLEEQAKALGAATAYSAVDAANAQLLLGKAGLTAAQTLSAVPNVLALASATGEDLANSASVVSDLMGSFGMKAEETAKLVDILAKAANGANVDVGDLFESLKIAAPIGKSLGQSVTDVVSAVSLLGNAGIKGSEAGTALRAMMSRLVKPAKDAQDVINELGIKLVEKNGQLKKIPEIFAELDKKMGKLNQTKKASALVSIFGQEALSAATILMDINKTGEIAKFSADLKDSVGVAAQMSKIRLNTLNGDIDNLSSAVESLAISFGSFLSPAIRATTQVLTVIANDVGKLIDTNGELVKNIGLVVGGLIAFKVAALAGAVTMWMLTPAITAVIAVMNAFKLILIAVNAVIALNPLGLLIIGLTALVSGLVLAYNNFENFRNMVKDVGNSILTFFATPIKYVLDLISQIPNEFLPEGWKKSVVEFKKTIESLEDAQKRLPTPATIGNTIPKPANSNNIDKILFDINRSNANINNNAIINVNVKNDKIENVTTTGDFKTKAFLNTGVQQ